MLPIFSTQHSTTSPTLRNWGSGFMKTPTPGGVPVRMMSPGRRVMNCVTQEIISGTPNTSWEVFES